MSLAFRRNVKALINAASLPGTSGTEKKIQCLQQLKTTALPADKNMHYYNDALLFTCAFPANRKIYKLAESEFKRITAFLKNRKIKEVFVNSGLPFTPFYSNFSHDFTQWLQLNQDCNIVFDKFKDASLELNDVLKLTLPSPEKSETTAALSNEELLDTLKVPAKDRLQFLLNELSKLDDQPFIKDHFYESLGIHIRIRPRNKNFSISYNRFLPDKTIYYGEPVKSFDYTELLNRPLPQPKDLNQSLQSRLITVVKNSMVLTDRETDTVTYMDETSLRYYQLEQGIAIAIYGMKAERQLPYESYVGYTLFVNGFPVAYGGAWVFSFVANFGINIFEAYRGGGSGYILCQLIRLYRQVFNINYFEIEPYQFGLDNPDGIKTGAFWFYYKYGFRPQNKELKWLSEKEKDKTKMNRRYRTPEKILLRFTESNMELHLGKKNAVKVADITNSIIKLISKKYKSNSIQAEKESVNRFEALTSITTSSKDEEQVLKEVSLWADAMDINDQRRLQLLSEMVKTKPVDLYAYQQLLQEFFEGN
jgi:hypothetical protein